MSVIINSGDFTPDELEKIFTAGSEEFAVNCIGEGYDDSGTRYVPHYMIFRVSPGAEWKELDEQKETRPARNVRNDVEGWGNCNCGRTITVRRYGNGGRWVCHKLSCRGLS